MSTRSEPKGARSHQAGHQRPLLELRGITKSFNGNVVVSDLNLSVEPGSIHALVGENGAGKSTVGKIIAGVHRPTEGTVLLSGEPVLLTSPRDASDHGVSIVSQEIALAETMTVLDNVFLGAEITRGGFVPNRRSMIRRLIAVADEVGFNVDPEARVGSLSLAARQEVEILRALVRDAALVVMDEPTAALSAAESGALRLALSKLRSRGVSVVFVSHFLDEVLEVADTITIMRDGKRVRSGPASLETPKSLADGMIGTSMGAVFPPKPRPEGERERILSVRELHGEGYAGISFDVHAGEILGLAGLVGSGRTEVARAIFGAEPPRAGTVSIARTAVMPKSPRSMINAGVAYVTESRAADGLLLNSSLADNIALPQLQELSQAGIITRKLLDKASGHFLKTMDVRPRDTQALAGELSGGNQQKVLIAKSLVSKPKVLIIDEPTRGVDIGAKAAIYAVIRRLASQGLAVLLISSEADELEGLSDRVLVMRQGRIVHEVTGSEVSRETIARAALGATKGIR